MSIIVYSPIMLPKPESFRDWQTWANALIANLQKPMQGRTQPPQVPNFLATEVPSGAVRGFLIEVSNSTGLSKLAISTGTGWQNVGDGSSIA